MKWALPCSNEYQPSFWPASRRGSRRRRGSSAVDFRGSSRHRSSAVDFRGSPQLPTTAVDFRGSRRPAMNRPRLIFHAGDLAARRPGVVRRRLVRFGNISLADARARVRRRTDGHLEPRLRRDAALAPRVAGPDGIPGVREVALVIALARHVGRRRREGLDLFHEAVPLALVPARNKRSSRRRRGADPSAARSRRHRGRDSDAVVGGGGSFKTTKFGAAAATPSRTRGRPGGGSPAGFSKSRVFGLVLTALERGRRPQSNAARISKNGSRLSSRRRRRTSGRGSTTFICSVVLTADGSSQWYCEPSSYVSPMSAVIKIDMAACGSTGLGARNDARSDHPLASEPNWYLRSRRVGDDRRVSTEHLRRGRGAAATRLPRNIYVAAAAPPRLVSQGMSTSPRRRRCRL